MFVFYRRVPLVIEVWHKDSMAGNVMIGVSSMSLATVLAANKVQVLSQVKIKFRLFDKQWWIRALSSHHLVSLEST